MIPMDQVRRLDGDEQVAELARARIKTTNGDLDLRAAMLREIARRAVPAHRCDDVCPWPAAIDGAYQSAHEAVRLAPNLSEAHKALGSALTFMRQHEAAIAEFDRATELNPNLTDYSFAWALLVAGEPARAIQTLEAHMRLDPFYLPHVPG
ncbi:hypothetical protein B4Q13_20605, partial [Lacticaseibacillus rhamnosus]